MSFNQDFKSWSKKGLLIRELNMLGDIKMFTHVFSGKLVRDDSVYKCFGINYISSFCEG